MANEPTLKARIDASDFLAEIKKMREDISKIADGFGDASKKSQDHLKKIEKSAFNTFAVVAASAVASFVKKASDEFIKLSNIASENTRFEKQIGPELAALEADFRKFGISIKDNHEALVEWQNQLGSTTAVRGFSKELTALMAVTNRAPSEFGAMGNTLLDIIQSSKTAGITVNEMALKLHLNRDIVAKVAREYTNFKGNNEALVKSFRPLSTSMINIIEKSILLQGGVKSLDEATEKYGDTADGSLNRAKDAMNGLMISITNSAGVKTIVKDIATQIEKIAKDPQAVAAIGDAIKGIGSAVQGSLPAILEFTKAINPVLDFANKHPTLAAAAVGAAIGGKLGGLTGAMVGATTFAGFELRGEQTEVSKLSKQIKEEIVKDQLQSIESGNLSFSEKSEMQSGKIKPVEGIVFNTPFNTPGSGAGGSLAASVGKDDTEKMAEETGKQYGEGWKNGAQAGATGAGSTLDKVVRGEQKIHSPSRLAMETGGFYSMGFGLGMQSKMGYVATAATRMHTVAARAVAPGVSIGFSTGGMRAPIASSVARISAPAPMQQQIGAMSNLLSPPSEVNVQFNVKIEGSDLDSSEIASQVEERVRIAMSSIFTRNKLAGAGTARF